MAESCLPVTPTHYRYRQVMQQLRLTCPLSVWAGIEGNCQWCDKPIPDGRRRVYCSDKCRRAFEREHFWPRARATARRRGGRQCINGCEGRPEVNHITPLVGAGYGPSCAHHQSNLELLCTTCHRVVTASQRSQRQAAEANDCDITSGRVDPRSYDDRDRVWASTGLSAPARRALVDAGFTQLADVANTTERFLLSRHGFGPSSLPKLRAALAAAGLTLNP